MKRPKYTVRIANDVAKFSNLEHAQRFAENISFVNHIELYETIKTMRDLAIQTDQTQQTRLNDIYDLATQTISLIEATIPLGQFEAGALLRDQRAKS